MSSMSTRSRGVISSPASTLSSPSLSSSSASSMSSMSSMSSVSPTASPRRIPSGSNNSNVYNYSPPAAEPQLNPATRAYKSSTPSLANPRTQDVFASIVKGRKSWKTLRGGEVVWPPELEAALIEGLENYQPDDSRETRLLGRFPMRNRFISDWIFERTGRRRSAKQVGSRLQQLRDTCGGKKLMKLLSPIPVPSAARRHSHPYLNSLESPHQSRSHPSSPSYSSVPFPPSPLSVSFPGPSAYGPPASPLAQAYAHNRNLPQQSYTFPPVSARSHTRGHDSESGSDSSTPTTPTDTAATLQNLLYRGIEPRGAAGGASTSNSGFGYDAMDDVMVHEGVRTVVLIDLLPEGDEVFVQGSSSGQRDKDTEEARYQAQGYAVARASPHARRLADIDPTTTLISRVHSSPAECYSYFTVYDNAQRIFDEYTTMQPVPHTGSESGETESNSVLYQTSLAPGYWDTIVRSGNASRYAIVQKVVRRDDSADGEDEGGESEVLFLATYRFVYSASSSLSTSTSSLSPLSSSSHLSASGYEDVTPTQLHLQPSFTKTDVDSDAGSYDNLSFDETILSTLTADTYQHHHQMDDMSGMSGIDSMMGYKSINNMNHNNLSLNINNNVNTTTGWMVDTMSMSSLNSSMPSVSTSNDWSSNGSGSMYASPVDNTPTQDMFGYTGM
ncbi:hypothetical protein D9619_002059 [Psilocybe cf. subviscida]|uniref:TEA domain-containing protein n=1 Tax=Psilocybe cf. subviscida TaxID=2480587 RepID=A0A8H5BFK5_9AGAR|nr:hypothetical protein D9619_002059 [Psilocybe cf. subviscida]